MAHEAPDVLVRFVGRWLSANCPARCYVNMVWSLFLASPVIGVLRDSSIPTLVPDLRTHGQRWLETNRAP